MTEVPVLIVGGGPVGLTASILLSRAGVRSLLVERHQGTAVHPKARAINARSMEMYRQCGVEPAIRAVSLAPERAGLIVWTRSLAGEEIERREPWRSGSLSTAVSPVRNALCPQDELEPVLRRFAEGQKLGELRFNTECVALDQDDAGVTALLADRASGATTRIRALYVIAADGAQSETRRQLGVSMTGRENVYESVNILFHADLRPWTAHRPAALYFVELPDLKATFLTINGADRWGFLVNNLSAYGYKPADFTPERAVALVRLAAGVPDLEVKILGIAPWTASALVAEQYRHGRIFLAGDAAHEMPPTGGFGLNTGVQDVHNLVWKLVRVLRGGAAPTLLDSYHDERQPVARIITEQSLHNSISMGRLSVRSAETALARPEFLNEIGLIFGASYQSTAVISDGSAPPVLANPVTDYVPSARPGSRAPHVWLEHEGARISTIDLIGSGFVLLTAKGEAWLKAARTLPADLQRGLDARLIGDAASADPAWQFAASYGIDDAGAVLVRPDGYVAWRSRSITADPSAALSAALKQILGKG